MEKMKNHTAESEPNKMKQKIIQSDIRFIIITKQGDYATRF